MRHRLIYILPFLLLAQTAEGQFNYRVDQSIPVEAGGNSLSFPWAGGINAVQVNKMDLDGDGDDDLVLFERTANKLLTFVNDNKRWTYAPMYESMFPLVQEGDTLVSALDQWLLLRDFNCDGKKDIFTHNNLGISVYVNTTVAGGPLKWRPFNKGSALLTIGYSGVINLQMNSTDVAGIDDVDGDGDLDVLDARFSNNAGELEWHRNMSIENTGRCDSMQLQRVTQKWGNFEECNCDQYLFNGDNDCNVFGGRLQHAVGKSILSIDMDNDGDHDLLFSEETCDNIAYLQNFGTADSAIMSNFTPFPSTTPVVGFNIFPAPFFEDVDFDGVPDLVVTSNVYNRSLFTIDFQRTAWLYKNTGTATLPEFTFVKNNFLQDEMIDVGDNSIPAFIDEDGDGDLDLFIASYNSPTVSSYLYFYENTGTISEPAYRFITNDYASLSQYMLYNMKIQFADLNADGKTDLVFTATAASSGTTSLYYAPGTNSDHLDIANSTPVATTFKIDPDENVTVVDVNEDGSLDLLAGNSVGAVLYYQNTGRPGSFDYTLQSSSFLGLGISTERQNPVVSISDLNADGNADLILGNQSGQMTIYDNFRAAKPASYRQIIWDTVAESYVAKNLGGRIWPVAANIFHSNQPAVIVGNLLGGLTILKSDNMAVLPEDAVIKITPNPATVEKKFYIEPDRNVSAEMYSLLGVRVLDPFVAPAHIKLPVDCSRLAPSVYILRVTTENKIFSVRMVIP